MARTSIRPEEEVPVQSTTAALVPCTTPAADGYDPSQYDDNSRDIQIPVLGLVGNTGPNAKKFVNKAGRFVLGELLLGEEVQVIPVALVKFFSETHRNGKEIKFDDKTIQRKVWPTAEAAYKDGGYRIDFEKLYPNRVEEQGRIGYLVLKPADITGPEASEFNHTAPDGSRFAVAKCTYHRGGYREVWRRVFDSAVKRAALLNLQTKGLSQSELFNAAQGWDSLWTLKAKLVDGTENSWWEPRIVKGTPNAESLAKWVADEFGTLRA